MSAAPGGLRGVNLSPKCLNGDLTLDFVPPPTHSWLAVRRDSVITQDVPGSSETRNNNRAKSVSPSIKVDLRGGECTIGIQDTKKKVYRLK